MRKSTTILATIALGTALATGSATTSMAHAGGGDKRTADLSSGSILRHARKNSQDKQHDKSFFSGGGYHYQPWWNYDTDAAYCSFDAVNSSYYGANGMWHSCP